MKFFQHWARVSATIYLPHAEQPTTVYGGSNISLEDAQRDAREKLAAIQTRIENGGPKPSDYDAGIREEVLQRISKDAVITRNRYGAEILNVTKLMFIDIDSYQPGILDFFATITRDWQKGKIVKRVSKLSKKYRELGFRVYETHNGIRVIVVGQDMDPRSDESDKMMVKFRADWLYRVLCRKQNCYRARLTPKPYRMRHRAHRVHWPRDAEQQTALDEWLQTYNEKSQRYAVCKHIDTFGLDRRDPLVDLHDRRTRSHENIRLA